MSYSKAISPELSEAAAQRSAEAKQDLVLVERVKRGEIGAFNILVKKYRDRLFAVVYNLTSNREEASDLTQDAFIKAFRSIHKFKQKSAFYTWLYKIAVNTTLNHLKKNKLRRFFSFETMDEEGYSNEVLEKITSNGNTKADKAALLNELQEKLNEALQCLSIKHRTIVVLHEIEGLSHKEIAEIIGSNEGTVRSRLHYAKQQLQSKLSQYIN